MEMLNVGDSRWRTLSLSALPPIIPLAATINNEVYISGAGYNYYRGYFDVNETNLYKESKDLQLFKWNKDSETFTEQLPGLTKGQGGNYGSVSVVPLSSEIEKKCNGSSLDYKYGSNGGWL